MTFHWAGGNDFVIAMHELLADFDFQCCRVNFYKLKSVVARLSIVSGTSENEKICLVNYDLGGRAKSDTPHISIYLNVHHQYIHIYMLLYVRSHVFVCCLVVFCDLWKNTSLHAALEKIYSLAV